MEGLVPSPPGLPDASVWTVVQRATRRESGPVSSRDQHRAAENDLEFRLEGRPTMFLADVLKCLAGIGRGIPGQDGAQVRFDQPGLAEQCEGRQQIAWLFFPA